MRDPGFDPTTRGRWTGWRVGPTLTRGGAGVAIAVLLGTLTAAAAAPARDAYRAALEQERTLGRPDVTRADLSAVIRAYEAIPRRHPRSGYSDNALWQAAGLALRAYQLWGNPRDRAAGLRMLNQLAKQYPSSSLVQYLPERLHDFETAASLARSAPAVAPADAASAPAPGAAPVGTTGRLVESPSTGPEAEGLLGVVVIRRISRESLPDGVRVTVELDGPVPYQQVELDDPRRLFFDFRGTQAAAHLFDATLRFDDDVVREIRLGRHPDQTTRVVLDLEGVSRFTVSAHPRPYSLVIDCERALSVPSVLIGANTVRSPVPAVTGNAGVASASSSGTTENRLARGMGPAEDGGIVAGSAGSPAPAAPKPAEAAPTPAAPKPPPVEPVPPAPVAPKTNDSGSFSVARQLGLGVSRIVIDPGHGGHDPGARANGVNEAQLVLDVALRLEKLLVKEPGIEVVLTRRADGYVPLEERTSIANREGADLFLSIHANASRNREASGVETYYLDFASGPDAEAVAARENAASGASMGRLPEIVKAIAMNNKLAESRDLATAVQSTMIKALRGQNRGLRDLGVKRAPFVVLIGAEMPSVLAEISFVTNKPEALMLRTPRYRQRIAESLFDAIVSYRQSLKSVKAAAMPENP